MCSRRTEMGDVLGRMNAAIDLFLVGWKKQGAWLILEGGWSFEDYVRGSAARPGELVELSRIFDYIAKTEARAARKATSHSDSVACET